MGVDFKGTGFEILFLELLHRSHQSNLRISEKTYLQIFRVVDLARSGTRWLLHALSVCEF